MEKRTDIDLNEYLKNQKKQQKYMEAVFQVMKDGMEKLKNEKDRVQFEYVGGTNVQSQQIEVFNKNNITNLRLYDEEGKLYFNDVDMTPEKGFDKLLKYIAINNEREGTEKINFPDELQNYVDFAKNITNKSESKNDNLMDIEISDTLLDKEKFHLNKYDETYISINTYRKNDWKENIDWNIRIKSHDRVINEFDVDNIGTEKISDIFTNIAFGIDYLKENGNKLDNVSITKSSEDIFDETLEGIKDKNINEYNYKDKISFMIYRLNRSTKYGLDELKYMKHIPLEYTFSMRIVLFSLFLYEYSQLNPPLFIFCLILFLVLYQSIKKRCEEFTKDVDKMIWHLKDHQKTMEEHLLNEEKKLDALKKNKT